MVGIPWVHLVGAYLLLGSVISGLGLIAKIRWSGYDKPIFPNSKTKVWFAIGIVLGVFFWYLPLIEQNQRYRQHILSLDVKIHEQERLARQLKTAIDSVQNDPRTLERLARERLGYARTNEVVIRFEARR